MSTVTRFIMTPFSGHGTFRVHMTGFPESEVGAGTGVFATITELRNDPPAFNIPFIGAARMLVGNIAPNEDGTIDAMVTIDWGSDLNIGMQILLVND